MKFGDFVTAVNDSYYDLFYVNTVPGVHEQTLINVLVKGKGKDEFFTTTVTYLVTPTKPRMSPIPLPHIQALVFPTHKCTITGAYLETVAL